MKKTERQQQTNHAVKLVSIENIQQQKQLKYRQIKMKNTVMSLLQKEIDSTFS